MNGPVKRAYRARVGRKGRKVPAGSPKATNFMNVKRRVIMKTAQGKFVVKTDKGLKYAPKAKYYRNPQGSTVNVKYAHANVAIPSPIRPKLIRKERKNAGAARGKYAARKVGVRVHHVKRVAHIGQMFEGYAPKRPVGRPRKHKVSPGGNMGLAALFGQKAVRKVRSNKNVKRGPRVGKKTLAANPFARLAM
jgi:hypothetical protein